MRSLGARNRETSFATQRRSVVNGVTVTDGDFTKLSSGNVTNATIGTGKLYGVVLGSDTENLFSQTFRNTALGKSDGSVKVLCELVEGQRYELDVNGTLASDAEGSYYNLLNSAQALLTSDGTSPSNNDTVVIGGQTYTFKTSLTGAANEVLIGANAAAALTNLKAAINAAAGAGSTYGTGTVANTSVTATTLTSTTLLVEAKDATVTGSAIAVTETSTHLAWDNGTLLGGTGGQMIDNTTKSATVGQFLCETRIATNAAGTVFRKGIFTVAAPVTATTPS